MKVRELMTEEVATAEPDSTLEEIAVLMRDGDVGSIPILDDGELVGIITDRDIVVSCIADGKVPSDVTAEEVMSEDLETIEPDADSQHASEIMARRQVRRLPVVEDGEFIGMISIGDIAVKEDGVDKAGEALEDISQGVKEKRGAADRGKPSTKVSSQRGAQQDISNRNRREEEQRQSKVTSQGARGKSTPRRKAS